MANENYSSIVLHEHRKIVTLRHLLALVNFIAILASTVVTRYFVLIRGTSDGVLLIINALCIINAVQIILCIIEYFTKILGGKYSRGLIKISYLVGLIWFGAVVAEFVSGSLVLGEARIDLGVIAALQLLTAILAYIAWPTIDSGTVNKMTNHRVRDDADKRAKKARGGVAKYIFTCLFMVVIQFAMLLAYKLPPKVYDLFSESRQLQYQLSEDGESYEVIGVYVGTSTYVNVPDVYNNRPVSKIKSGALSNTLFSEANKITKIDFGSPVTDEDGNVSIVSNVLIIESGAIDNDKITSLVLPVSVVKIEDGAIVSDSLKTLTYESKADFSYSYLECSALNTVTFNGLDAGKIISLEGMASSVTLEVPKDTYNNYREKNHVYMSSIRPILADNEFVVDFYTGTDNYYIESIFATIGETVDIKYSDLKNDKYSDQKAPTVDTLAYMANKHETGTDGVKKDSAFRGWYFDKSYTNECVFDETNTLSFTGDTTIYAKWIDEYTGTLDWGTYQPDGQPVTLYWTDEDLVTFPVINDRFGFDGGIVWSVNDQQVTSSQNISDSVTVSGKWMFNTPEIDVNPYAQNSEDNQFVISTDKNTINFVYDEYQSVHLEAVMSHEFDGMDKFFYSTEWVKVGDSSYNNANKIVDLQNVAESGEYILKVTANSPYGDTSVSETRVNVSIARKDLDIGNAELNNKTVVYDALEQRLTYEGVFVHDRIAVSYTYFDQDDNKIDAPNGVKNAGRYKVIAEFAKNNPDEAANYGTRELIAELVITKRELVFVDWSSDEFTYNTDEQGVYLEFTGVCGTDSVELIYEGNTAINTGTYVAKAINVSNSNYSINTMKSNGECTHTWTIAPKEITVKEWKLDGSVTSTFKITYNGQTHNLEAVPEGVYAIDEDTVKFIYDDTANKVSAIDANIYTAKIVGVTNGNYVLADESTQSWEIQKKELTVYFDSTSTLVYNGKAQNINATVSGIVASDIESFDRSKLLYTDKSEGVTVGNTSVDDGYLIVPFSAKNASVYNLAISGIDPAADIAKNYTMTKAYTKELTISPKAISFINDGDYTYNGKLQSLELKVDGIVPEDIAGVAFDQFTLTGAESGALEGNYYVLKLNAKDAGTYAINITAFSNSNYVLSASEKTIVIKKQVLNIDWFITDKSGDGEPASFRDAQEFPYNYFGYDVSAQISGIVNSEGVVLNLVNADDLKNAGSYTTTAKLVSMDAEVNKNYEFVETSISWKITPYVVNFNWKQNGMDIDLANGKVPTYTYNKNEVSFVPVYKLLGDDTITITYADGKSDLAKTNAKSSNYKVHIESIGNSNYVIGSGSSFEWKINPQTITVNWSASNITGPTYNGDDHKIKFTVSGLIDLDGRYIKAFIYNDGSATVWENYAFETASSKTEYSIGGAGVTTNAGEYLIYFDGSLYTSDGNVDSNYEVKCTQQILTVAKAPITLAGWKYSNGDSLNNTFSTTSKLIYNSKYYTFSNQILTNLCKRNGVVDDVYLTYTVDSQKNAGDYTTSAVLSGNHASNYYIVSGNQVSWKIEPKVITVDWIVNDFIYSGSNMTQSATYTANGVSVDDYMVYPGDSLSISYSGNKYKNAGEYTAEITSLGNNNYELAQESQSYSWSIARKPVSISWSSNTFTYNGAVQYPTASYSSSVRVTEYDMDDSKNVGVYIIRPLSATSLSDSNYIIDEASLGTYTYEIKPKAVTFSWGFNDNKTNAANYTYDGVSRVLNAYVSNICSGDTVNVTYDKTQSQRTIKNAGEYSATVTGIDNDNYVLQSESTASKTITVSKRNITLSWIFTIDGSTATAGNITYDGKTRTVSAKIDNLCSGDNVTLVYNKSDRAIKNADTYSFAVSSISGSSANNYQLSSGTTKDITINRKELRFDWFMKTGNTENVLNNITYDGKSYTVSARPTSATLVSGDKVTVVLDKTNFKNATSYTFIVERLEGEHAANYVIPTSTSYNRKTITVSQQVVSLQWYDENGKSVSGSTSFVYDGKIHALTAKITATSGGSTINLTPTYKNSTYSGTNAGSYTFEVTGLSDSTNYALPSSGKTITLQITAQPVVITWSGATQCTYDGYSHGLSVRVVGANDGKDVNHTLNNNDQINAGNYDVTVSLGNSNYTLTGAESTKRLVISPQTLTIKWYDENGTPITGNSKSLVYDGSGHRLYAKAFNEKGEEIAITMDTTSTVTSVTTKTYNVSRITSSGYNTTNYKLPTAISATLTITPQPVRIVWDGAGQFDYDGRAHKLTATVVNKNSSPVSFSYNTSTDSLTNAGTLTRTIRLDDSNYTLDGATGSVSASVTINPIEVNVIWSIGGEEYEGNSATIVYDGSYHYPVVTITDMEGNVLLTYTGYSSNRSTGTYTYNLSAATNLSNYTHVNGATTFYMVIEAAE